MSRINLIYKVITDDNGTLKHIELIELDSDIMLAEKACKLYRLQLPRDQKDSKKVSFQYTELDIV